MNRVQSHSVDQIGLFSNPLVSHLPITTTSYWSAAAGVVEVKSRTDETVERLN
jgi:hypothetical protein